MKGQTHFPLWLICDPGAALRTARCRTHIRPAGNVTLYTRRWGRASANTTTTIFPDARSAAVA